MNPWKELPTNRSLLDASFETYRLSLEKLPVYKVDLPQDVRVNRIQSHMISREHVKMFSSTNQLFQDRWNAHLLYLIAEDLSVYMLHDDPNENQLTVPLAVYSDENLWRDMHSNESKDDTVYQPSLAFPSDSTAILSDGQGYLKLLNTGKRTESHQWTLYNWMRRPESFVIFDAVIVPDKNAVTLLTGQVCEEKSTRKFTSVLTNTTLSLNDKSELTVANANDEQSIHTFNIDYVSALNNGKYLMASNSFQFDSSHAGMKRTDLLYVWYQDDSSVTAYFALQSDMDQSDLGVVLQDGSFCITLRDDVLLRGDFPHEISSQDSGWTIPELSTEQHSVKRLVLKCKKKEACDWTDFWVNSTKGEQVFDSALVEEMLTCLIFITKDGIEPGPAKFQAGSAFMAPREDCDATDQDQPIFLVELASDSLVPNKVINMTGDQWLFNIPASQTNSQSFCVRHAEDGLVFIPSSNTEYPVTHEATFNALGYIQASKQRRRFSACSPDFSYAVIAELDTHVYVYRQPEALVSDMRNRKTGKVVKHTAKQQVITLEESRSVLGVAALTHALFILTKSKLYKYVV